MQPVRRHSVSTGVLDIAAFLREWLAQRIISQVQASQTQSETRLQLSLNRTLKLFAVYRQSNHSYILAVGDIPARPLQGLRVQVNVNPKARSFEVMSQAGGVENAIPWQCGAVYLQQSPELVAVNFRQYLMNILGQLPVQVCMDVASANGMGFEKILGSRLCPQGRFSLRPIRLRLMNTTGVYCELTVRKDAAHNAWLCVYGRWFNQQMFQDSFENSAEFLSFLSDGIQQGKCHTMLSFSVATSSERAAMRQRSSLCSAYKGMKARQVRSGSNGSDILLRSQFQFQMRRNLADKRVSPAVRRVQEAFFYRRAFLNLARRLSQSADIRSENRLRDTHPSLWSPACYWNRLRGRVYEGQEIRTFRDSCRVFGRVTDAMMVLQRRFRFKRVHTRRLRAKQERRVCNDAATQIARVMRGGLARKRIQCAVSPASCGGAAAAEHHRPTFAPVPLRPLGTISFLVGMGATG